MPKHTTGSTPLCSAGDSMNPPSGLIQPERVEPDHVVDAEIIFWIVALHVVVRDVEDIFPCDRGGRRFRPSRQPTLGPLPGYPVKLTKQSSQNGAWRRTKLMIANAKSSIRKRRFCSKLRIVSAISTWMELMNTP
jgi:hypothetical protein